MTLADAGDTVEDANFVEAVAEANLLRLYSFYEWCKETYDNFDKKQNFRFTNDTSAYTYADKVFENEINKTILTTKKLYDTMMYKEVLKSGFFELQSARDRYRELCFEDLMHSTLIKRFIEVQLILLSPICPHICEHIWLNVIQNKESILKASWPTTTSSVIDEPLLNSSSFLMEAAHDFRTRQKTFSLAKSKVFLFEFMIKF
jgi:leucyl-tRNA synthetase